MLNQKKVEIYPLDELILLSYLTKIYTISAGQMLNTQIANVKNRTPKQPVLGIFGLFLYRKKLHFYHSGATTIFFQKCKKHPNKKNRILFFLLPDLSMMHLLQVTDANIGTHRHSNNIIFE